LSPAPVTLVPVAEPDFAVLRELAATIWRRHYAGIVPAAQIDFMLAGRFGDESLRTQIEAPDRWLELLRVAGEPVGYCGSELAGDDDTHGRALKIGQLYVHETHRGAGLGSHMLAHLEARARAFGRSTLRLQVNKRNTTAIAFYRGRGFAIVRAAVFDIGGGFVMDDYVMEKRVAAEAPVAAADGLTSRSGRRGDRRG